MDDESIKRTIELYANARLGPTTLEALPVECLAENESEAYDLQYGVQKSLTAQGLGEVVGYKVGLVSPNIRAACGGSEVLGIDSPAFGGIFASRLIEEAGDVPFDGFNRPRIEGEFAIRLGTDVSAADAPFSRESVRSYVDACMAGIELVDFSVDYFAQDPPIAFPMIIDNSSNWGGVFGAPRTDWQDLDLASLGGHLTINGKHVAGDRASVLLGHPFEVLAWCLDHMTARGMALSKGTRFLLGAVTPNIEDFEKGAEIVMSWDELGKAQVRFT